MSNLPGYDSSPPPSDAFECVILSHTTTNCLRQVAIDAAKYAKEKVALLRAENLSKLDSGRNLLERIAEQLKKFEVKARRCPNSLLASILIDVFRLRSIL